MTTVATPVRAEATGQVVRLGAELARGGEGELYAVDGQPQVVAKVYFDTLRTNERAAKLQQMLAHPPSDPARGSGHRAIAWPTSRLLDAHARCIGFLMPGLDRSVSLPLYTLYNPRDRKRSAPAFTWQYLMQTAANLAAVVEALHAAEYVVGDVNESNVLVNTQALVTLVDCDSMQVPRSQGGVFRCPVGKPEYTPPELHGQDLAQVDRGPEQDRFGLVTCSP